MWQAKTCSMTQNGVILTVHFEITCKKKKKNMMQMAMQISGRRMFKLYFMKNSYCLLKKQLHNNIVCTLCVLIVHCLSIILVHVWKMKGGYSISLITLLNRVEW